jgi:glutamate-1-semialdehyde aminotransferase/spore coat polysaccharide biosynthesis protein SpsF (cytidylyltransferase family)
VSNHHIVAIIQARHNSSRFPGKVLTPVSGKPLLAWQLSQLARATTLDKIVVATSGSVADDPLIAFCKRENALHFRGSEVDVLDRTYRAASHFGATIVVRLTADCPLIDPAVVDEVVHAFLADDYDYAANTAPPPGTFPDGMDVEVFSMAALTTIWNEARAADQREHVTFAFWQAPERFRTHRVDASTDMSDVRLTVDYPSDLDAIELALQDGSGQVPPLKELVALLRNHFEDPSRGHTFGEGWVAPSFDITSGQPAPPLVTTKGDQLWQEASQYIPGGGQTFSKSPLQYVKGTAPKVLIRGIGSRVWDADGNEFIDCVLGLGPAILGHCHPVVNAAASECANELFLTPSLPHPLELKLAKEICRLVPSAEMVRFGKNGSDVTAGATRIARGFTGRNRIACCGYHGWQDWYIGSTTRNLGVPPATAELTTSFPYGDLDALEAVLREGDVAGVILEPISLVEPPPGYLQGVRDLCTKYGALLIFDEIITGFRIHLGGAQAVYGVTPDLSTLGKGIAAGFPLAVLCGKREYMQVLDEAFFSFTFGGELPSIAAAIKTLEIMQAEDSTAILASLGSRLIDGMQRVAKQAECTSLKSIGLPYFPGYSLSATESNSALELQTLLQQELVRRGVLTRSCFFLSTAHSTCDIDRILDALLGATRVLQAAILEDRVLEAIDGQLIEPVFRASSAIKSAATK